MSDRPRFVTLECEKASNDRVFKNNKCVFNTRLGFAYSVDEIVEVLNNRNYQSNVYELLQNKIWYCQGMYNRTNNDKYKFMEKMLRELREELYEPKNSSMKYGEILKEWSEEK